MTNNELNRIILNNTIPNALLFTGNLEEQKKQAAIIFVKTVNCMNREIIANRLINEDDANCLPCNKCKSCIKIDAAMHPDIINVAPEQEKAIIKIAQIRELCNTIASKPHEAKMRMVIIEDAHTMNQEAANAILKILEEPPERTFFILLARDLNDLLPTIISRCRHIRFRPISQSEVQYRLISDWNIPSSIAMIAAKSSNGDMEKAMMFSNVKTSSKIDWIKRRRWILKKILLLINPHENRSLGFLYALALAEKMNKEIELVEDSLSIIKLWFRDIALIRYNMNLINSDSRYLVNLDFINELSEVAQVLPDNYPFIALEAIYEAEKKLLTNASVRMILEQFFLSLILCRQKMA